MYMYVECVFSEIVCSALCFHNLVCMHLLLDHFFNDFLPEIPKIEATLNLFALKSAHFYALFKTA